MFALHKLPEGLHWRQPSVFIASGLGSGLLKPASGTFGSLLFFLLILPFWSQGSLWHHLGVTAFLILLGALVVKDIIRRLNEAKSDPSWVVIDEWAGLSLALLTAYSLPAMLVGLALFRFFDILKPWPIKWIDAKISGAWGVMADDLAAGLASLVILILLRVFHVL